jgi:hypothetical protein
MTIHRRVVIRGIGMDHRLLARSREPTEHVLGTGITSYYPTRAGRIQGKRDDCYADFPGSLTTKSPPLRNRKNEAKPYLSSQTAYSGDRCAHAGRFFADDPDQGTRTVNTGGAAWNTRAGGFHSPVPQSNGPPTVRARNRDNRRGRDDRYIRLSDQRGAKIAHARRERGASRRNLVAASPAMLRISTSGRSFESIGAIRGGDRRTLYKAFAIGPGGAGQNPGDGPG